MRCIVCAETQRIITHTYSLSSFVEPHFLHARSGPVRVFGRRETVFCPPPPAAGVRKAPRHEIASAGSAGRCRGLYMATGREVKAGRLHKREVPMRTAKVG